MCQTKYLFHFLLSFFLTSSSNAGNIPLPLGIVFGPGTPEVQAAFKHALLTFNLNISTNPRDIYRFTAYVDTINTADAFKLSKLICNQFSRGIYALVGSMNAESFSTYHAFANTFHMPLITPWYPSKDVPAPTKTPNGGVGRNDVNNYATRLRPDYFPAILDTINYYGWKEIIYLYSTNEGLLRLQTLFYRHSESNTMLKVKLVKKISSAKDAIAVFREIESTERFTNKYVLLDCPTTLAKEIIISHVRDVQLGRRTYHYLLAGLAFDDPWEPNTLEFNAVNITGFRMIDPNRRFVKDFIQKWLTLDTAQFLGAGKESISASAGFMYDAMLIIKEAFTDILTDNPFAFNRYSAESACESGSDFLDDIRPFEYGQNVNQHLRRVQTEGLSGNIQFHENGTRKYFTVDVMEMRDNVTKFKIGHWTDYSGFKIEAIQEVKSPDRNANEKDVYIVSTILEEPYLKLKSPSQRKSLSGNDIYEGYMKDLADILFSNLGLKYRFQLVRDGKYGAKIPTPYGENWNGIVGEILRSEVDLSLAPLTITEERERVLEFTKPFLTHGISIMAFKPKKNFPGMFSFMNPLSDWVWLSVLAAYLGVSTVFYFIYRLTTAHYCKEQFVQHHQRVNGNGEAKTQQGGNHTQMYLIQKKQQGQGESSPAISNFLWMAFSILTNNRGTSFISKSLAGRLASMTWWLFALILVSVYTGNYIAIRMRNKATSPIRSAWDLVESSAVQYGTLESGSTYDFFKKSENQVYRAMFEHISGPNQLNFPTYEDGVNLVRQKKGKYVFLMESSKIEYISSKRPCNTMKVGYDLAEIYYGIGLAPGSPLTEKLNLQILLLKEKGILQKLEESWWKNKVECEVATRLDKLESPYNDEELSLKSLAGIFYILIIGMVIAVLVSLIEFFCSPKEKEPSTRSKNTLSSSTTTKPEGIQTSQQHHHLHQNPPPHHSHYQRNSHCQSAHQNAIIDSVPMPNDFCDISPDMTK